MPRPASSGWNGWAFGAVLFAAVAVRASAQETEATPRIGSAVSAPRGAGLNAAVTAAAVHDSAIGWYSVVVPVVSYAASARWSADASLPLYPYRLSSSTNSSTNPGANPQAVPTGTLRYNSADLGDTLVRLHGNFGLGRSGQVQSTSTVSMTLPTGNRDDGLGTGRTTFNFDTMITKDVTTKLMGRMGVFVDAGAGDSSGLANRQVTEDDASLGPQAEFAAGMTTGLPAGLLLESYAYEQLPLGDQKTYMTLTRPGFPNLTVPAGRNVYEDNGFNTSLYLPLSEHITLSGAYNRSLRLHLDTVSVGVTYVWRGRPLRRRSSEIDRAMREAESGRGDLPYPGK